MRQPETNPCRGMKILGVLSTLLFLNLQDPLLLSGGTVAIDWEAKIDLPGHGFDKATGVAVDPEGNVLVAGSSDYWLNWLLPQRVSINMDSLSSSTARRECFSGTSVLTARPTGRTIRWPSPSTARGTPWS